MSLNWVTIWFHLGNTNSQQVLHITLRSHKLEPSLSFGWFLIQYLSSHMQMLSSSYCMHKIIIPCRSYLELSLARATQHPSVHHPKNLVVEFFWMGWNPTPRPCLLGFGFFLFLCPLPPMDSPFVCVCEGKKVEGQGTEREREGKPWQEREGWQGRERGAQIMNCSIFLLLFLPCSFSHWEWVGFFWPNYFLTIPQWPKV